uniref:Uncharacterized protein n=1 Tax=Anguilla anguilla TaxID=7936 RepID=A0A0E9R002_ANGAN
MSCRSSSLANCTFLRSACPAAMYSYFFVSFAVELETLPDAVGWFAGVLRTGRVAQVVVLG